MTILPLAAAGVRAASPQPCSISGLGAIASLIKKREFNRPLVTVLIAALAFASVTPASASQISYTYDAQGRLVRAERTGGTINASNTLYTYDAAGNRTSRVVQGGAASSVAIVPYTRGYRIIHLKHD